jgi:hypothetical protein
MVAHLPDPPAYAAITADLQVTLAGICDNKQ